MFSLKEIDTTVDYTPNDAYLPYKNKINDINAENVVKHINQKLDFMVNWDNIVLAGGSIITIVQNYNKNENYKVNDYDFFFYDIDQEGAENIIKNFQKYFENIKISASPTAITIIADDVKYQFITKLFKNKEDIINSFDIDASCVYFDGENIMLNKRCKDSIETGYNIVNFQKYSCNYSVRLIKYYQEKGMGLIFRGLGAITFDHINLYDTQLKVSVNLEDDMKKLTLIKIFKNYNSTKTSKDTFYDMKAKVYYNINTNVYYTRAQEKLGVKWDDYRNGLELSNIYGHEMTFFKFYRIN